MRHALALFLLACVAPAGPDAPDDAPPAAVATDVVAGAAEFLLSAQGRAGSDVTWQWRLADEAPAVNVTGVTALGLLAAHEVTGEEGHLEAALASAHALLEAKAGPRGQARPYSQDVEFLAAAGYVFDAADWFGRARALYPRPASYADLIIDGRAGQNVPGLAGWDVASAVRAALAVGQVGYAEGLLDRLLERWGDWDHREREHSVTLSYGALLWALGRLDQLQDGLDPTLLDLAVRYHEALEQAQLPGGGFPLWGGDAERVDVQTTAYAALGLWHSPAGGRERARRARDWLAAAAFDDGTYPGTLSWATAHRRVDGLPDRGGAVNPEVVGESLLAMATIR